MNFLGYGIWRLGRAWISKQLLANKQVPTLVNVLGPLANATVTVAEQGANN